MASKSSTKKKPASKAGTGSKSGRKKQPAKKETVTAGKQAAATARPRPGVMSDEPSDVDEYETMRQAAVEPFRREGAMPKPGAAGRLFDDEDALEDYDPLFDEVGEEEDE